MPKTPKMDYLLEILETRDEVKIFKSSHRHVTR